MTTFAPQLTQFEGQLARDQALLDNARLDLSRYRVLWGQNSIPKQQLSAEEHGAALPQRPQAPYNEAVADDFDSADDLAVRLQTAFDLCELGEAMRLAQLRREHPGATPAEIEALLVAWLETRPGAEHGDGWGLPISWPPSGS